MALTLKAARVNKGLTQADAAKLLGITADVLGNWERARTFPNALQIQKIVDLYGVPYDQLIFLPHNHGFTVTEV